MNGEPDYENDEEVRAWSPERAGVDLGPIDVASSLLVGGDSPSPETPAAEPAASPPLDPDLMTDPFSDPWRALAAGIPLTSVALFGDPSVWDALSPNRPGVDEAERSALLLRQIEWVMWRDVRSCLACGREQERGHADDCPLSAALADQ